MRTNNLQNKIKDTLNTMDVIEEVKVSPFFKDKTMHRLFAEKEVARDMFSLFSPKLQLATLVCFILINVYAFSKISAWAYEKNVTDFAETYGLSLDSETIILN